MNIAVSGAHRTGKTTLIGELAIALPTFEVIEEPYYQLEDEGYVFAELPSLEDFEAQLVRSIASIVEAATDDCLFERCPCDMLAYAIAHDESERFDFDRWIPSARDAMRRLDLVIFVPIEQPDRMTPTESDHELLRERVDVEIRGMVLEDQLSFGVPAIEVHGPSAERARQVLVYLAGMGVPP